MNENVILGLLIPLIGTSAGFTLMMTLDVALG